MKNKAAALLAALFTASALSVSAFAAPPAGAETSKSESYYEAVVEETYNGTYELYEQLMCGEIVFYTSIENGGMTPDSVTIEVPSNVDTELTKDGSPVSFKSNTPITEDGSYILKISVSGDQLMSAGDNEVYYTVFRFRIKELPEGASTTAPDVSESVPEEKPDTPDTSSGAEDNTGDTSAPSESDTSAPEEGTATEEQPSQAPEGDTTLITQMPTEDTVVLTTKGGTEFYSNIPKGMITTEKVKLSIGSETKFELYHDGKLIDYTVGDSIIGIGKYQLFIFDDSGDKPAEYDFEIMNKRVSALTEYTVPSGCVITKVLHEGSRIRSNNSSVTLGEEGLYSVDVLFGSYSFTESFTLDNTPPEFVLDRVTDGKAYGGTVTIMFVSDDIDTYEVTKDGKPMENKRSQLSEPGKYTVVVYDDAGNSTEQSFELEYRMNEMAIISLVLLGLLVVAAVVFVFISRKKFIIR